MKSYIAGIVLAGSLATAQGIENAPADTETISPLIASGQIQQKQKNRINSTLNQGWFMKVPFVINTSWHEVGDLFMELVPEAEYGNIHREKAAIGEILKSLAQLEPRLSQRLDGVKKIQLRTAIIDLRVQYQNIGTASFNREQFEDSTYDALLRIVTSINVESLQHLRATLRAMKPATPAKPMLQVSDHDKKDNFGEMSTPASRVQEFASQANLEMYTSLYMLEKIYLESNPQLLATCWEKFPQREELRHTALMLISRVIATVPSHASQSNSTEHDMFRDKLNQIRKRLYPQGEMGYVEAQKWGFEEQVRRNKATNSKKI